MSNVAYHKEFDIIRSISILISILFDTFSIDIRYKLSQPYILSQILKYISMHFQWAFDTLLSQNFEIKFNEFRL